MAKSIVLEKGTTLQGGKYVIQRKLGQGGFGITYEATLVKLKKRVAMKESFLSGVCGRGGDGKTVVVPLDENVSFFEKQKERFMDEALRLANLSNPHIVPVFDSFEENGTYYYVMDFIEGESLSDKLKRGGKPFDEGSVMVILDQLLDALDCIHSEVPPLCHLDIKPANIMMNKKGKVILVDFGASKYASTSDVSVSSSSVAYTPGYAPFEQVYNDRKNMGPWTDFYAVGATLFCLFTGERPSPPTDIFQDSTPDKHASIPLPGSLSPMMKKLILWMMSLPQNDRPESVNQIRDFISQYKVTDGYGKTGGHGGQDEHHEMDELEDGDELIVISASQSPVDSSDSSAHSDYSEKTTPPAASREETALPDDLQVPPAANCEETALPDDLQVPPAASREETAIVDEGGAHGLGNFDRPQTPKDSNASKSSKESKVPKGSKESKVFKSPQKAKESKASKDFKVPKDTKSPKASTTSKSPNPPKAPATGKVGVPGPEPRSNWMKPVGYAIGSVLALLLLLAIFGVFSDSDSSQVAKMEGSKKEQVRKERVQEKKTEPEQTVQEETPVENQMVAEEGTDTTTLASEQKPQETAQPEAHVKNDDPNEGKYKSYLSEARAAYNRANYDGALASLNKINALGKTYSNRKDVTGLRSQITSAKAAKDKKQMEEQDKKKKEEQKQKEIDQKCRSLFSNASAAYKNSNLDAADNYIRQIESLSPSYARRSEVTNLKANIKKSKANLNKWGL